jgi:hypothetical protein
MATGDRSPTAALRGAGERPHALGRRDGDARPQVAPAIEISAAIRAAPPRSRSSGAATSRRCIPIPPSTRRTSTTWCAARVRRRMLELLDRLPDAGPAVALGLRARRTAIRGVAGLTWKQEGARSTIPTRPHRPSRHAAGPPYERLARHARVPAARRSWAGARAVHQSRLGVPLQVRVLRRGVDVERQHAAWTPGAVSTPRCTQLRRLAGAPTACSSTTTTSSIARRAASRARGAGQAGRCRGGATRAPTRWRASARRPGS